MGRMGNVGRRGCACVCAEGRKHLVVGGLDERMGHGRLYHTQTHSQLSAVPVAALKWLPLLACSCALCCHAFLRCAPGFYLLRCACSAHLLGCWPSLCSLLTPRPSFLHAGNDPLSNMGSLKNDLLLPPSFQRQDRDDDGDLDDLMLGTTPNLGASLPNPSHAVRPAAAAQQQQRQLGPSAASASASGLHDEDDEIMGGMRSVGVICDGLGPIKVLVLRYPVDGGMAHLMGRLLVQRVARLMAFLLPCLCVPTGRAPPYLLCPSL